MKNEQSTFERIMKSKKRRAEFDREYQEFLISEFLIEAMDSEKKSVRALAKESGVSAALIQNLRSGKSSNVTLKTLIPLLQALHYRVSFEKMSPRHATTDDNRCSVRRAKGEGTLRKPSKAKEEQCD